MNDLLLSFSPQTTKLLQVDFPRLNDASVGQVGVATVQTHSTQQAWQVHMLHLHHSACGQVQGTPYDTGEWLFIAVEAYSRFTILTSHWYIPTYEEWYAAFQTQYWKSLVRGLAYTQQIIAPHHLKKLQEQWQLPSHPHTFKNYDQRLGGIITDVLQWLWAYLYDVRPKELGEQQQHEFIDNVNSFQRSVGRKTANQQTFRPYDRFLEDCLYRYGAGLNTQVQANNRSRHFPNPHRSQVQLSIVKNS